MKKVKKGEVGLLINPSHVNTLITEEDIDREIEKVLTGDLTYQKRIHDKDLIVSDEDYLEYLELCKKSVVKPSHPVSDETHEEESYSPETHEEVSETPDKQESESLESKNTQKSDASLERYQKALKDLLTRVKFLEADQTSYYTGDKDLNTVLTDILSDYDTTKLTYLFTLRGLYGHKKAKEIISKQYGVDFYDSVIKQLED